MSDAPVFVVSTGRTGTKFLCQFFDNYGVGVSAYHCPRGTRLIHVLANAYETGLLPEGLMRSLWSGLRAPGVRRHRNRYVECNAYYYNLVDTIRASFPQARFIFVIRSPKGFIQSYMTWERNRWKSKLAAWTIPLWQPISYLEQLKGWAYDYHQRVEFYSKVWARKNASVIAHGSDPASLRVLRFEDLFDETKGRQILRDLLLWLDIPAAKPISADTVKMKVNASTKQDIDPWDERCDEIVRNHCRELMAVYGYTE